MVWLALETMRNGKITRTLETYKNFVRDKRVFFVHASRKCPVLWHSPPKFVFSETQNLNGLVGPKDKRERDVMRNGGSGLGTEFGELELVGAETRDRDCVQKIIVF
jgi:hypothetical protein